MIINQSQNIFLELRVYCEKHLHQPQRNSTLLLLEVIPHWLTGIYSVGGIWMIYDNEILQSLHSCDHDNIYIVGFNSFLINSQIYLLCTVKNSNIVYLIKIYVTLLGQSLTYLCPFIGFLHNLQHGLAFSLCFSFFFCAFSCARTCDTVKKCKCFRNCYEVNALLAHKLYL